MSQPGGEVGVVANGHATKEDDKRVEKFNAAVRIINHLPKEGPFQPSNDLKLRFYAFFKAATEGPCREGKPAFWDVVKRAKWDAWKGVGEISKEEAMDGYIAALQEIIETMSFDDNIQEFMAIMGPFYEYVHVNGQSVTVTPESSTSNGGANGASVVHVAEPKTSAKPIPNGKLPLNNENDINSESKPEERDVNSNIDSRLARTPQENPGMGAISEEDENFADATDSFVVAEMNSDDKSSTSNSPPRAGVLSRGRRRHSSKKEKKRKVSSGQGQSVGSLLKDLEEYDEIVEPRNCGDALDAAVKAVERLHRDRKKRGIGEFRRPSGRSARGRDDDSRSGDEPANQGNGNNHANLPQDAGAEIGGLPVENRGRRSHGESGSGSDSSGDSMDLDWDPHVAVVLFRMHRELQGITRQLDTMESVMISQQRLLQTMVTQQAEANKSKLLVFTNLPWKTICFILGWPFVVNIIWRIKWKQLILRLRRR